MARSDQGNELQRLILQPGSSFVDNKGKFDSGTRTFVCDEDVASRIAPRMGESDVEVILRARAKRTGTRRIFPAMFVTSVSDKDMGNGLVEFTVGYEGQKNTKVVKKPEVVEDIDTESFSTVPTGGYVLPVTFQRPIISVTRIYVSHGQKPDPFATGSNIVPPGYKENPRPSYFWTAYIPTQTLIFEGWILRKRSSRSVGSGRHIIWETTDQFVYEYITSTT